MKIDRVPSGETVADLVFRCPANEKHYVGKTAGVEGTREIFFARFNNTRNRSRFDSGHKRLETIDTVTEQIIAKIIPAQITRIEKLFGFSC